MTGRMQRPGRTAWAAPGDPPWRRRRGSTAVLIVAGLLAGILLAGCAVSGDAPSQSSRPSR
jgi:hypothetical protein